MNKYNHIIPRIKDKVEHMPHVYYFNLDSDIERRNYMEEQFNLYGINYTRVSQSKYLKEDFCSWSDLLSNPKIIEEDHEKLKGRMNVKGHISNVLVHLEHFIDWYNNTNDEHLIIMEDDYDLSLIEYWHFTWKYLMSNIPYDWDAIQFSFEPNNKNVCMFLHPRYLEETGFGAMMLNRNYVKKMIDIAFNDESKLITTNKKNAHKTVGVGIFHKQYSPDSFIGGTGMTYRIPLITMSSMFYQSDNYQEEQSHHFKAEKAVKEWWKNKRDEFSLEDFFTYGKPNDSAMVVDMSDIDYGFSYG